MLDIAGAVSSVEHDAHAAQHGDGKALAALHRELGALSPSDLNRVAEGVQKNMGESSSHYSKVEINRDEQGSVMSLEFSPSIAERAKSWLEGSVAHALHVTITPINNVNASPEMVQRANAAFRALAPAVRETLLKGGIEVRTVDKIPDASRVFWRPWLTQSIHPHPRGYPDGATWENNSGYQDSDKIYMAEHYRGLSDGKIYKDDRIEATLRHESGHRLDNLLGGSYGNYSDSQEFKAAYQQDIAKVPAEDRRVLDYYLQKSGGRSETFAEQFAILNGGGACTPQAEFLLAKYFGNTAALIQKKLDKLKP